MTVSIPESYSFENACQVFKNTNVPWLTIDQIHVMKKDANEKRRNLNSLLSEVSTRARKRAHTFVYLGIACVNAHLFSAVSFYVFSWTKTYSPVKMSLKEQRYMARV